MRGHVRSVENIGRIDLNFTRAREIRKRMIDYHENIRMNNRAVYPVKSFCGYWALFQRPEFSESVVERLYIIITTGRAYPLYPS